MRGKGVEMDKLKTQRTVSISDLALHGLGMKRAALKEFAASFHPFLLDLVADDKPPGLFHSPALVKRSCIEFQAVIFNYIYLFIHSPPSILAGIKKKKWN